MNLRLVAQAKSRTFSAAKIQVFVPSGVEASLAFASSGVTMKTGTSDFSARSRRARWPSVSTLAGFCNTPVDATTWSSGTVIFTT